MKELGRPTIELVEMLKNPCAEAVHLVPRPAGSNAPHNNLKLGQDHKTEGWASDQLKSSIFREAPPWNHSGETLLKLFPFRDSCSKNINFPSASVRLYQSDWLPHIFQAMATLSQESAPNPRGNGAQSFL